MNTSPNTVDDRPAVPDLCATAGVLGIAAAAWFAWSLAGGELSTVVMVIAAALGLGTGIVGFVLRRRADGTSVHSGNPASYRTYNRSVLFEVAAILAGNLVLGRLGLGDYIPAWTMAMMGLHFVPLARLYRIGALRVLGFVVVALSGIGALAGLTGLAMPATVCCSLGGLAMLITALWAIRAATRDDTRPATVDQVAAGR